MVVAIAIAVAASLLVGCGAGAALVRYGMGLAERAFYSARTGNPALGRFENDSPLLQDHTGDTEDE